MYSRWYNVAVFLLWLATMGWLVVDRVLPPLLIGEPPGYLTILEAQQRDPGVGWEMAINGEPFGWAWSQTTSRPNGPTEVDSWVHFNRVPLGELTPGWVGEMLGAMPARLKLDAESKLMVDPLGRLVRFDSALRLDSQETLVSFRGETEGSELKLSVFAGKSKYETTVRLPAHAVMGDVLSPQTHLPGLQEGQTWTVPTYNPLHPRNPLEILQAEVEGTEPMVWDGRTEEVWLVVYRTDTGLRAGKDRGPCGRLWVRADGVVLKQESRILDSTLSFVRLPDYRAEAIRIKFEARAAHPWSSSAKTQD